MKKPDYVKWVTDDAVIVKCKERNNKRHIKRLGGHRSLLSLLEGSLLTTWHIRYKSEKDMANIFSALRDIGMPFLGGAHGWPPAAIFEHMRDKQLLKGTFKEIVWRGPEEIDIRDTNQSNKSL